MGNAAPMITFLGALACTITSLFVQFFSFRKEDACDGDFSDQYKSMRMASAVINVIASVLWITSCILLYMMRERS